MTKNLCFLTNITSFHIFLYVFWHVWSIIFSREQMLRFFNFKIFRQWIVMMTFQKFLSKNHFKWNTCSVMISQKFVIIKNKNFKNVASSSTINKSNFDMIVFNKFILFLKKFNNFRDKLRIIFIRILILDYYCCHATKYALRNSRIFFIEYVNWSKICDSRFWSFIFNMQIYNLQNVDDNSE